MNVWLSYYCVRTMLIPEINSVQRGFALVKSELVLGLSNKRVLVDTIFKTSLFKQINGSLLSHYVKGLFTLAIKHSKNVKLRYRSDQ